LQQDPIPPEDITTIDGIPVTKPARTLLDLATVEREDVIERCLDDLLRRRLVSCRSSRNGSRSLARCVIAAARVLQKLVDARATVGITESPLETQLLKLLQKEGLPIPMLQYVVEENGRFIARLDFAYPEQRVAIEADGFRYHDKRQGFDAERARGNEVEAMGWRVLRITSAHLLQEPASVISWVRRALT